MQFSSSETAAPVFLNMGPLMSSFTAYVKPKAAFVASHEVDPCEVKRDPNPHCISCMGARASSIHFYS